MRQLACHLCVLWCLCLAGGAAANEANSEVDSGAAPNFKLQVKNLRLPNWQLEAEPLGPRTYAVTLHKLPFRGPGDGEAMSNLRQWANGVRRGEGFSAYRILEYYEGQESAFPLPIRYAHGVVEFIGNTPK